MSFKYRFAIIFFILNLCLSFHAYGVSSKTSDEVGLKYLNYIKENYPYLIQYFDKFRLNDTCKNTLKYSYGEYGFFSVSTLKNIKIAGDIFENFQKVKGKHIVELWNGSCELCSILSNFDFASYTIICNREQMEQITRDLEFQGIDNVSFVDSENLFLTQSYDLFISNLALSNICQTQKIGLVDSIISHCLNAYVLDIFESKWFIHDLIFQLLNFGKYATFLKERPLICSNNHLLIWKEISNDRNQFSLSPIPTFIQNKSKIAVSYVKNAGRLGDDFVSYAHAKWVAYKYKIPFLYTPFPYSKYLAMDKRDQNVKDFQFLHRISISNEKQIRNTHQESTLVIFPYSPECKREIESSKWPYIKVDWEDPGFKYEILQSIKPATPINTIELPNDILTVGIHVRRGGNYDNYRICRYMFPLKFPPDSYYLEQLKFLSEVFEDRILYVFILTDDLNPQSIVNSYKSKLNNPNLIFSCRNSKESHPSKNVLEDFFTIPKFDCFIRCESNFSIIGSKISEHMILISPRDYKKEPSGEIKVIETEIICRGNVFLKLKTHQNPKLEMKKLIF